MPQPGCLFLMKNLNIPFISHHSDALDADDSLMFSMR